MHALQHGMACPVTTENLAISRIMAHIKNTSSFASNGRYQYHIDQNVNH
jgi:hypothetical protein